MNPKLNIFFLLLLLLSSIVISAKGSSGLSEKVRINTSGNVGIGTMYPNSKLQVSGGDAYIESIGSGIILKSPDGTCYRITVANGGGLVTTAVTCP